VNKRFLPLLASICFFGIGPTHAQEARNSDALFFGVSDERHEQSYNREYSPYYQDKERGWFWYEDPAVLEDENQPPPASKPIPSKSPLQNQSPTPSQSANPSIAKPLSAEWFRKNMEKYRDKAIDDPSPENVGAYLYLQRVMLDKAEKYAQASQLMTMKDPVLDENARRPIATFGAFAKDEMATIGTQKAAKKLAEKAGLWFFYLSNCTFCLKEAGVLKGLMNAYGFKVLPVALDGLPLPNGAFPNFTIDQGQAKKLGVETTPALFLVKPGGTAIQLGQGLLSSDEIVNRAITLAHEQGWLTTEEYQETRKVKTVEVDSQTIQSIDEKIVNNPNELINIIRNNLKQNLTK